MSKKESYLELEFDDKHIAGNTLNADGTQLKLVYFVPIGFFSVSKC